MNNILKVKRIGLISIRVDVGCQVLKAGGLWGYGEKENVGDIGKWAGVEFLMILH